MTINKAKKSDSFIIEVEGRLETTTAPELEAVIKSELDGVTILIMDFSKLDYISSAGLRVLLAAQKIMNAQGEMKIVGSNDIVLEIFEITGFADILTLE
ncbi:MAG: STAS domain-containing protein [Eubacterium sp.]|nr:STAS domain-containing protein [Eubacterium sp.]